MWLFGRVPYLTQEVVYSERHDMYCIDYYSWSCTWTRRSIEIVAIREFWVYSAAFSAEWHGTCEYIDIYGRIALSTVKRCQLCGATLLSSQWMCFTLPIHRRCSCGRCWVKIVQYVLFSHDLHTASEIFRYAMKIFSVADMGGCWRKAMLLTIRISLKWLTKWYGSFAQFRIAQYFITEMQCSVSLSSTRHLVGSLLD